MASETENAKCRTCLAEFRNMISITADYIVHDKLVTIADIIVICTSVQISPNDNFPQYVCETCVRDAISAYTFKRQCEETDQLLKSQLLETKSQGNNDYFCYVCNSSYNCLDELSKHLTEHDVELSCDICSLKFKSSEDLEKHVSEEHATIKAQKQTESLRAMRKSVRIEEEPSDDNSKKDPDSDDESRDMDQNEAESIPDSELTPAKRILKSAMEKNTDGLLQCLTCDEYFQSKRELQKHTRKHKSFKCKICGKVFTIVSNLRRHLRAHIHDTGSIEANVEMVDVEPEFKCISCAQTFSRRKFLSEHLKSHKDFACSMCSARFTFASNLRKHLRAHNKPKDAIPVWKQLPVDRRTCDICFKVFKYRPSMLKHRKKHNMAGKKCQYCGETYESSIKLYKHMEEQHQHEKNIICAQCGKKFFREWNLKMHMIVHTGLRPYMCEVCGMSFALQGNLASHRRLHTGVKPYKCATCGKGFTQQAALRSHEAGHSNRRDFICPDCGKGFSRIGAMKNHRKRHENSKPFPCYMCDKKFTFSSERKRHMTIHTGEKRFSCDICGRAFNRPTNLKVHMQIHTRDYRHKCKHCGKGFIQAHVLKSHLLIHEKKLAAVEKEPLQDLAKHELVVANQTVMYEYKDGSEEQVIEIVFSN